MYNIFNISFSWDLSGHLCFPLLSYSRLITILYKLKVKKILNLLPKKIKHSIIQTYIIEQLKSASKILKTQQKGI